MADTDEEEFAGHTPEPWVEQPVQHPHYDIEIVKEGIGYVCRVYSIESFGDTGGMAEEEILAEVKQNAALIRAAPRLLRERNEARKALAESEAMRQREGAAGYSCVKEMELTTLALVEARARIAELEGELEAAYSTLTKEGYGL